MKRDNILIKISTSMSLLVWAFVVLLPLSVLFIYALTSNSIQSKGVDIYSSLFRSFVLSAIIAGVSVLLGWIPGRLLGTSNTHKDLLLLLLLMPLVLPRYLLYYAWWLLLSPTTSLGAYLSKNTELARFVATFSSTSVLIMWYWPLAALLLGQGWRNIDRQIWDSASLDSGRFRIFKNITLPLLKRSILLAFGVCFVMSLSEFATFNLAGIKTIGTELAVLYQLTGSEAAVARASWPVTIAALILAIILSRSSRSWVLSTAAVGTAEFKSQRWRWFVFIALMGISLFIPVLLFITNVSEIKSFQQFFLLHFDELEWSFLIAFAAALLAFVIAYGAFSLQKRAKEYNEKSNYTLHIFSLIIVGSIFLVMLLPASIIAVSILKILAFLSLPDSIRQSWFIVSIGQACRFAGVALIFLLLTRYSQEQTLSEMAKHRWSFAIPDFQAYSSAAYMASSCWGALF